MPAASLARRRTVLATVLAVALLFVAAPRSSAATAPIHPGVRTYTNGAQCTANFVFVNGSDVYLGQAAHCSGQGSQSATNGCDQAAAPLPLGTPVEIDGSDGSTYTGTLAYSSWNTMLADHETDANTCDYNDFALVKVPAADVGKVDSSLPTWGGPVGLRTTPTTAGETVYTYGSSELRFGLLSAKRGTSEGTSGGGWTHTIFTNTPGIPGDSGSAVLDHSGKGLGVLVTIDLLPGPGTNGVSDLNHVLAYARTHSLLTGLTLKLGTQPFTG